MISKIEIPLKTFIEFGVENYRESNTRYLLIKNNWSGYVIDGDERNIDYINQDIIIWACELHTKHTFITAENINELLVLPGFGSEVGLLSIDIDGNDYWVWKSMDTIRPIIVVCEYNSLFGMNTAWTIPYNPSFSKYKQNYISYYGASLKALVELAEIKGYCFVGCNSNGNNAYFVRKDKMVDAIPSVSIELGYVLSKFREVLIGGKRPIGHERITKLEGLPIWDIS